MANLPSPRTQLIDAINDLLTEHGAMDPDDLIDAIEANGLSLGEDEELLLSELLESDEMPLIRDLDDGRFVSLPALVADRTFTHRVTNYEIEHDLLAGDETLAPLLAVLHDAHHGRLVNGGQLRLTFHPFDLTPDGEDASEAPSASVDLPPGTLQALDLSEDDLIGVRLTEAGVAISRADDVEMPPADIGPRILTLLLGDPDIPADVDELVWQLCADDPALLRVPLPPLSELFDMLGLPHEDGLVALPGFDFEDWHIGELTMEICERHDLEPEEATTVLFFVSMCDAMDGIAEDASAPADESYQEMLDDFLEPPDELDSVSMTDQLALLARPHCAAAALDEVWPQMAAAPERMVLFLEMLRPMLPRAAWPAVGWMKAKAYQEKAATAEAEAALADAEALDPAWPLTLIELAHYASDRGDAAGALTLLRRAKAPNSDQLVQLLQGLQSAARPEMRRNQPCWCGSGRKYKMCHLGREQLPLEERATWLYAKAAMHLVAGRWRGHTIAAGLARLTQWGPDSEPAELMADGLITDAVLFEGGGFQDFLAVRGELLPEDERLLGQQWVLSERSLYEVEAVHRGQGLNLRDVRTGDRISIRERKETRQLTTGTLICAHMLPAGDRHLIAGGLEPIRPHERDEVIALLDSGPSPADVVDFLSRPRTVGPGNTIDLTDPHRREAVRERPRESLGLD
jgi:hypothetical protein